MIALDWVFSTMFKPLFEPLVTLGIERKLLRGAPEHGSSLCNRFRGFSRRSCFAQTLPASRGACEPSECMVLSSCCGQQANFQNFDLCKSLFRFENNQFSPFPMKIKYHLTTLKTEMDWSN